MSSQKFKHGQIIRYGFESTDLMAVSNVILRHMSDGHNRYYGAGFFGGSISASERDCSLATEDEIYRYKAQRRPIGT